MTTSQPKSREPIPDHAFQFDKYGISADASELARYDFLQRLPRGDTGFWVQTPRRKVLFVLRDTEEDPSGQVIHWHFANATWAPPRGKPVHLTIANR
ncbi:hypothetical protein [Sphingosinicella sp. BN140058]|uniref:hypothetical protein n=1 Tax=Sphingosinicella sp. BN140058 TaxID=1892855 RepID=UPI0010131CA4|nr:hypothetical protein [Sphingosinicella sp. BN140058]QAY80282.1 hypothetical protein ETR14_26935 [Sphingosinicella sp. BN140058]